MLGIPLNSPGGYVHENVHYRQYTAGVFALHENYWAPESEFGKADSTHGCVGLRLADAEFFWDFADIGTPVVIHD